MKNEINYNLLILNLLFCFFPISFVVGNFATNLNIILLILIALILYNKKIIKFKFLFFDKILLLFFIYIFFNLLLNYIGYQIKEKVFPEIILYKTLLYFRFLALYFVIRFLIYEKIIKLKFFYILCSISVVIISSDILYQFVFDKNIIGITPISDRHYSGFFGSEFIAGSYIQKFSLFVFFLPIILKYKNPYKHLIQFFIFLFFLLAIILSGNRMPLILYLFSIFLIVLLNSETRKYFIRFFFISLIFLSVIFYTNSAFKINTTNFYLSSKILISTIFNSNLKTKPLSTWQRPYVIPFYCGKILIKDKPFFGGGIRSYRLSEGCSTHPHNYYLEITTELGLYGLFIFLFFLYKLLFKSFKNFILNPCYQNNHYFKMIPPFFIFLIEFFPIRSSGSFFSTNNATNIFIIMAILVSFHHNNTKN